MMFLVRNKPIIILCHSFLVDATCFTRVVCHHHRQHQNLISNSSFLNTTIKNLKLNVYLSRYFCDSGNLDEKLYEKLADNTLDNLNEKFEEFFDKIDDKTCDIVLNNGVMTISLGNKGIYVINRQTPNRQLWLSSPISGPKRYDYVDGKWIYKHDGKSIQDLLEQELRQLFNNVDVKFS